MRSRGSQFVLFRVVGAILGGVRKPQRSSLPVEEYEGVGSLASYRSLSLLEKPLSLSTLERERD